MLTTKQFGTLKKVSVGVNPNKSNVRVPEAFKSAKTEQKSEIIKLSGLSKFVFYKASTSPRAILALSCVLGISPYYLTGESDDRNCNDDIIKEFYNRCRLATKKKTVKAKLETAKEKTAKAAKTVKVGRKPASEKTKENAVPTAPAAKTRGRKPAAKLANDAPAKKSSTTAKVLKIDEDSLVALLKSLSIRAKFGGEAEMTYNAVVQLLIK